MKNILFVDDEPNILEGLQRMLFPLQKEWKMAFVSSGHKALDLTATQPFDVIVSDMRMPSMDGAQLLAQVKIHYPNTVRFILTGQTDSETIYRSVGNAHQFLNKPCKPAQLKECIDKAFAIRDLLASKRLKSIITQIGSLPPVPEIYQKLCDELQSPECSVTTVGHIIETDPAMVAKILQLVNSAFFGLRRKITTPAQATSLLGLHTIKSLILTTGLFTPMEQASFPKTFSIEEQWQHSTHVGAYAEAICKSEDIAAKDIIGDSYTAGLLHDAGKLILAASCPEEYIHVHDYANANQALPVQIERELLGYTHAEIGGYLLGIWGLPDQIVEAVAYHHQPMESTGRSLSPLTIVHIADILAHAHTPPPSDDPQPKLDTAYLREIGLEDHLAKWTDACTSVDARQEEQS